MQAKKKMKKIQDKYLEVIKKIIEKPREQCYKSSFLYEKELSALFHKEIEKLQERYAKTLRSNNIFINDVSNSK